MTEHKKLLAEKCVELLYRRGVCPTNIELKYKKETNISYISLLFLCINSIFLI